MRGVHVLSVYLAHKYAMKILKRRRNARQRCYHGQGDLEDARDGKQKPSAWVNDEPFTFLQNYIWLCML